MPTLQEYAQLSNDAHNRADDFLFLDFTPGDIQKHVGDEGSSLQAGEGMKLYPAANLTEFVIANITNHLRGDCIAPVGVAGTSFGPSKVAKIKADGGVSQPCGLGGTDDLTDSLGRSASISHQRGCR